MVEAASLAKAEEKESKTAHQRGDSIIILQDMMKFKSSEGANNENLFKARVMEKQTLSDGKLVKIKLIENTPGLSLKKESP